MSSDRSGATTVAIACQGGGAHSAFCAGALEHLLVDLPPGYEIHGVSGTSGGALTAATAWYGLLEEGPAYAARLLEEFWADIAAGSLAERAISAATTSAIALDERGLPLPAVSPYANPWAEYAQRSIRRSLERVIDFDRVPDLAGGDAPLLLVSAVAIRSGAFRIFSGPELTADTLLASAAVPELFEAVAVDGEQYWDGLFAQNPPVANFLSAESADEKPDEIWILQVNPSRRENVPTSLPGISNRKSELTGNLALNQELRFIERINELVERGALDEDRYKQVGVERVRLATVLSFQSQFDRSPEFIDALREAGRTRARTFLDERIES